MSQPNWRTTFNANRRRPYICECQRCTYNIVSFRTWKRHNASLSPSNAMVYNTGSRTEPPTELNIGPSRTELQTASQVEHKTIRPTIDFDMDMDLVDMDMDLAIGSRLDTYDDMPPLMDCSSDCETDSVSEPESDSEPECNLRLILTQVHNNNKTTADDDSEEIPDLISSSEDNMTEEDFSDVDDVNDQLDQSPSSDDSDDSVDPGASTFQDALQQALLPIYEGSRITVLALLTVIFRIDSKFKSKLALLRAHFDTIVWTLPPNHNLPDFKQCRQIMEVLSDINVVHIPCCSGCDFLFYNRRFDPNGLHRFASLSHCPKCGTSKNTVNGQPRKTFSWIGINDQLKQRYHLYMIYVQTYYVYTLIYLMSYICACTDHIGTSGLAGRRLQPLMTPLPMT